MGRSADAARWVFGGCRHRTRGRRRRRRGTSTLLDALVLVVVLALIVTAVLGSWLARELAPARPHLPADDCPPAGASRLVPSGRQLEQEVRAGLLALELWLAARRPRP